MQVAQALGITLPNVRTRKRKATVGQAAKLDEKQAPGPAQPVSATDQGAGTATPAAKRQRRAASKQPPLPGEQRIAD